LGEISKFPSPPLRKGETKGGTLQKGELEREFEKGGEQEEGIYKRCN